MRVLNATQMRAADRKTIDELGVPSLVLMENAGRQVAAVMQETWPDLAARRVIVICGCGNNGGDGFVVSRTLEQRGVHVATWLVGRLSDVQGDARVNLETLTKLGFRITEIPDLDAWEDNRAELAHGDVIVDAIFGTGLGRPLDGLPRAIVADLNALERPVVSIDLPTGLSADGPEPIGETVRATITVTMGAPKLPLVLPPGKAAAGKLVIADIGIPGWIIDEIEGPRIDMITRESIAALIPARAAESHKGDYGRLVIAAGSMGKTGAARLAALGALRSGAGLVTVATPRSSQPIVATLAPEYMTEGLPEAPDGTVEPAAAERVLQLSCDVLAAGPGLGAGAGPAAFVHALVERAMVPLVLDADALNAYAADPAGLHGRRDRAVIITPHPGEMARLTGQSADYVQANRLDVAQRFAADHDVFVVLKGSHTLVATPDGRTYVNPTGNPGMATGGTGDVLTGMIAAWLAQLGDPSAACRIGVYLHGLAGDMAARDVGEVSLIASDLLAHVGAAIRLTTRERDPHVERAVRSKPVGERGE